MTCRLDHYIIKMPIANPEKVRQDTISSAAPNVRLQNIRLHGVWSSFLRGHTLKEGHDRIIVARQYLADGYGPFHELYQSGVVGHSQARIRSQTNSGEGGIWMRVLGRRINQ